MKILFRFAIFFLKNNQPSADLDEMSQTDIGLSRVYSDRQLNSDRDLVCFIFQILE